MKTRQETICPIVGNRRYITDYVKDSLFYQIELGTLFGSEFYKFIKNHWLFLSENKGIKSIIYRQWYGANGYPNTIIIAENIVSVRFSDKEDQDVVIEFNYKVLGDKIEISNITHYYSFDFNTLSELIKSETQMIIPINENN